MLEGVSATGLHPWFPGSFILNSRSSEEEERVVSRRQG